MAPAPLVPQQPVNTAFLKELQKKENKSQDEFLGNLLSDEKLPKDHIALKHSSSSSSGGASKGQNTKPIVGGTSKAPDDADIYTQLSINLWKRVNAGYLVPRRPATGVMRSVFTYDPNLIEPQTMEFHRKRDFYSEYNEAAARFKLVHGNKKPLSKPKRAGKAGEASPPPSSAENAGTKPLDGVQASPNNADGTNPNTSQAEQNAYATTNGANPAGQSSAPTTTTVESKPAEPTS